MPNAQQLFLVSHCQHWSCLVPNSLAKLDSRQSTLL